MSDSSIKCGLNRAGIAIIDYGEKKYIPSYGECVPLFVPIEVLRTLGVSASLHGTSRIVGGDQSRMQIWLGDGTVVKDRSVDRLALLESGLATNCGIFFGTSYNVGMKARAGRGSPY